MKNLSIIIQEIIIIIIIDNYILINPIRDNIQQSLVFTLSNNTAYFFSNFEVLKNNEVLPKSDYAIKKKFIIDVNKIIKC